VKERELKRKKLKDANAEAYIGSETSAVTRGQGEEEQPVIPKVCRRRNRVKRWEPSRPHISLLVILAKLDTSLLGHLFQPDRVQLLSVFSIELLTIR
jgi:hypothetical protein